MAQGSLLANHLQMADGLLVHGIALDTWDALAGCLEEVAVRVSIARQNLADAADPSDLDWDEVDLQLAKVAWAIDFALKHHSRQAVEVARSFLHAGLVTTLRPMGSAPEPEPPQTG